MCLAETRQDHISFSFLESAYIPFGLDTLNSGTVNRRVYKIDEYEHPIAFSMANACNGIQYLVMFKKKSINGNSS